MTPILHSCAMAQIGSTLPETKTPPGRTPAAFSIASKFSRLGGVAREPLAQPGLGSARADLHVDGFAVLVEDHRGDRADAVLHGRRGVLVDVQLDDLDLAAQFSCELFEHRRNGTARAAPFSPEIDEHGLFGRKYFLAE